MRGLADVGNTHSNASARVPAAAQAQSSVSCTTATQELHSWRGVLRRNADSMHTRQAQHALGQKGTWHSDMHVVVGPYTRSTGTAHVHMVT